MTDLKSLETKIQNYFARKSGVTAVNLFGSYAKGSYHPKSDVDIAVLFQPQEVPSGYDLLQWQEDLSELLEKEVDLICLNKSSPILGMQVAQEGKTITQNDDFAYAEYLMYLFSGYAELKELRAPMEKNMLKRKYFNEP